MEEISKKKIRQISKRILIVISENISKDGVQIFLKNMLNHMDISGFLIHLYAPGDVASQLMLEDFLELGVTIILGHWDKECDLREFVKHDIEILMKQNSYDIVHCNTGKVWMNYYCCVLGEKYGIPVRIAHSHNALLPRYNPEIQKQDDCYRKGISQYATACLSCSDVAARWLYGNENKDYGLIKNGIELSEFVFSDDIRSRGRKEMNLEGKFVIGHIGAFVKQKNHKFLLEIFREIAKKEKNSVLLMVGKGELKVKMEKIASDFGIREQCFFLGERTDIPYLLAAMDVFVLPSLYEGLSIAAIEAQAASLPCVVSDGLTKEADILGIMKHLPLNASLEEWVENILKYKNYKRADQSARLADAGYDVTDSAFQLYQLYQGKEIKKRN